MAEVAGMAQPKSETITHFSITIPTGVKMSYYNIHSKVEALLRQLHWWKARDLSLRGKVLIVKALALS